MRRWRVAAVVAAGAVTVAGATLAAEQAPPPLPPAELLPASIPVAGPDGQVVGSVARDALLRPPERVPDTGELIDSAQRLVSPPTTAGGG